MRITHDITRREGRLDFPWRLEVRENGRLYSRTNYSSRTKAKEAFTHIRNDILLGDALAPPGYAY